MDTLPESEQEEQGGRGEGQEEVSQELTQLEDSLSNICVTSPDVASQGPSWTKEVYMSQCPASYQVNSPQEKQLLAIADNFRCQYTHIYPDRKPLLLCPLNECDVKKFVCTTLRCTVLPYAELYTWECCASFVADCLSLELLEPPVDLPGCLFSPTLVLQRQRGTCFDFSTLLCSLLLGDGYNAYCVSGYAVKEMCLRDQNRQECPLLVAEVKHTVEEQEPQVKKYSVKPPRELKTSFERRQEEKRQEEARAVLLITQQEAQRLQEESERPPPDPLLGLRVHCWVLVLSGKREVAENFFIDPLTGKSYSTTDDNFLGIESIWNQHNYWVNMQDCRYGCADMVYELGDTVLWESVLCGSTSQTLLLSPTMKGETEGVATDDDDDEEEAEEEFEMPQSWVGKITVSKQDMERRWPGGLKVTRYRKAKLEQFAPYLLPDGLVTRLTTYKDLDLTEASVVKEWYQNRHDQLEERELRKVSNVTTELFRPGRSCHLKSLRYVTLTPDTQREMEFYSKARVDELVRRVESPGQMTETFQDRDDFLYYRHVVFGQPVKVLIPRETPEPGSRPIQTVVERFHRNRARPASEDVAQRVFLLAEERIEVTYHLEDDCIIPASRTFIKPRESQSFTSSMVSGFQVDPFQKRPKTLSLYRMLKALMEEEEKVTLRIKDSVKEACLAAEDRQVQEEKEMDILAPFLAQLGAPDTLTRQAAVQLRLDCLAHLKQRLINRANIIQARLEKETQELQQKQQWYQQNQLTMTKEDEDEYLAYCSETTFRIHVLKRRLTRHKDTAPQKYLAFDWKLRRDPRLAPHLLS
ncbi:dynein regulatory complex subunit 7 isoform 2-T2 [Polymixia lowei]